MKIFICANLNKDKTKNIFPQVVSVLKESRAEVYIDERYMRVCRGMNFTGLHFGKLEENASKCDIFLTIGGDGTILRWGKRAAFHRKPLLGINTGRVGFMANLEKDELYKLKALSNGEYEKSRRMLIDVKISANGTAKRMVALNDVVMFKGVTSKLPEYVVSCGATEVSRIRADGLIISTPTGSTAYSLSAGGPIIAPNLSCFELTALSPHNLFNRPMIFSTEKPLKASYISYESSSVFVSVDGEESTEIFPGDTVLIERSRLFLDLIDIDGDSFFGAVHSKLMRPLK